MKAKVGLVLVGAMAVAALALLAQSPTQEESGLAKREAAIRARLVEQTEGFTGHTLRELQGAIVRLEYKNAAERELAALPADDIWALREAFHRRIDSIEDVSMLRSMFRAAVQSQYRNEDLDRALERSSAKVEAMRRFHNQLENRGVDLQEQQE